MAIITADIDFTGKPVFVFKGKDVLACAGAPLPFPSDIEDMFEDSSCGAAAIVLRRDAAVPEGGDWMPLRRYFATMTEDMAAKAARMKGLASWRSQTRFCGSCGAKLEVHEKETAMVCPSCGRLHFPRIEPCIIVIVQKGDDILLLRHVQRNQDLWCCLAGFVETGESVEQALVREVREETSLEVCNIRYMGSQSWPFPDQLMLAFYADYKSGEIKVQEDEIFEARWFNKNEIPTSPGPGSISWRLIHFDF